MNTRTIVGVAAGLAIVVVYGVARVWRMLNEPWARLG